MIERRGPETGAACSLKSPLDSQSIKQISRVIDSIQCGCGTSAEVAEYTGIPLKTVSSYVSQLKQEGLVVVTGKIKTNCRGTQPNVFVWAWGIA